MLLYDLLLYAITPMAQLKVRIPRGMGSPKLLKTYSDNDEKFVKNNFDNKI